MLNPDSQIQLVDPSFQPPDAPARSEVSWTLRLQAVMNYLNRINQWFVERPLRLCLIWSCWLSFLYFAVGPASYVKVPDCGNGTLPAREVLAQQFVRGELGNWMSFSGCGVDRIINNYRLEPHCILLAIFPGWLGYGLIMWLQRFIAMFFMWKLTRDDLHLEPQIALLTAMSYSLFNQNSIHCEWDGFTLYDGLGIPGLPLLFWVTNRLTQRSALRSWPIAVITGIVLGLAAPFFQTIFFPFLALFWYSAIQPQWTWNRLGILTCVFIGWAMISLPEMAAAAKYVPDSHRSEIIIHTDTPYVKYIENVQYWANGVLEDNRVYLLAAVAGLVCMRFRDRRLMYILIAIGGVLLLVRYYYVIYDHTLSHLGVLASFHFHRLIYQLPFLCSIAMGLGLSQISTSTFLQLSNAVTGLKIQLRPVLILLISTSIVVQSAEVNGQRWRRIFRGESYQLLYQHPDLLALADQNRESPDFRVACISDLWRPQLGIQDSPEWSVSPGICWSYGFETTDGYQVLYSKRFKHYWTQVIRPLITQDPIRMQQHMYWGNMMFLWHPSHKSPPEMLFNDYYNLRLLSLANTRYIISPLPIHDLQLKLLPSEHREQFLRWKKRKTNERMWKSLSNEWAFKPIYIYENLEYLPRCFLAPQAKIVADEFELLADLRNASATDLRQTIRILQTDIPPEMDLSKLQSNALDAELGTVQCVKKSADDAEYEITTTAPCMFFLSNSYHPAWKAKLNHESVAILPAQLAFQGIYIPAAGKHRLELHYQPAYSPATYWQR